MKEIAKIIIHNHELAFGRRYETYEWDGKPWWPVEISKIYENELDNIPWPLKKIGESSWMSETGIYIRKDGALAIWAFLVDMKIRVSWFIQWFYVRLIMTAMVWGLAYVPVSEIPSWRHLGKRKS